MLAEYKEFVACPFRTFPIGREKRNENDKRCYPSTVVRESRRVRVESGVRDEGRIRDV